MYNVINCTHTHTHERSHVHTHVHQGSLSSENLKLLVERKLCEIGEKLRCRSQRLKEFGDYEILQGWLLSVRGVELRSALTMGCKPLAALPVS